MSSSVVVEKETDRIRPFAWRTVALSGESLDRRRSTTETKSDTLPGRRHPLEARIAELEKTIEERAREAGQQAFREGESQGRAQAEVLDAGRVVYADVHPRAPRRAA